MTCDGVRTQPGRAENRHASIPVRLTRSAACGIERRTDRCSNIRDMSVIAIREATDDDLDDVLNVECRAFGGETEAELVRDLLADPSAEPRLSLVASLDGHCVGHILFTTVILVGAPRRVNASILGPLAVMPEAQSQGIGGKLIGEGLRLLGAAGVELVFVLGHPGYYPRFGFEPAGRSGFEAPYPIAEEHADAWMVQALRAGVIGSVAGRVQSADTLSRPELWRE